MIYNETDAKASPGINGDEEERADEVTDETGAESAEEDAHPKHSIDDVVIHNRLCDGKEVMRGEGEEEKQRRRKRRRRSGRKGKGDENYRKGEGEGGAPRPACLKRCHVDLAASMYVLPKIAT